jgi:hypothetical protein
LIERPLLCGLQSQGQADLKIAKNQRPRRRQTEAPGGIGKHPETPVQTTPTWKQFLAIVRDIRSQKVNAAAEDSADLVTPSALQIALAIGQGHRDGFQEFAEDVAGVAVGGKFDRCTTVDGWKRTT